MKTPAVENPMCGNKRNEYVSALTIKEIHKLLKSAFEQAVKWELIEKNPCIYANVPKHKYNKREIWTAETLMYAIDVCDNEYLKLAWNLSFCASLRIGELLALSWDCVDISENAIEEGRSYLYVNKELQRVSKEAITQLNGKDVLLTFKCYIQIEIKWWRHQRGPGRFWTLTDQYGYRCVFSYYWWRPKRECRIIWRSILRKEEFECTA